MFSLKFKCHNYTQDLELSLYTKPLHNHKPQLKWSPCLIDSVSWSVAAHIASTGKHCMLQ